MLHSEWWEVGSFPSLSWRVHCFALLFSVFTSATVISSLHSHSLFGGCLTSYYSNSVCSLRMFWSKSETGSVKSLAVLTSFSSSDCCESTETSFLRILWCCNCLGSCSTSVARKRSLRVLEFVDPSWFYWDWFETLFSALTQPVCSDSGKNVGSVATQNWVLSESALSLISVAAAT